MSLDVGFYLVDHRLITLAMVALLVAAGEIGFRRGVLKRESKESVRSLMSGTGGAMLGLLGLLLGFTLSMAVSRWDARRDVIVNEANAIGTLWLRAGFLEDSQRDGLRDTLRDYTDARIALGGSRGNRPALRTARSKSESGSRGNRKELRTARSKSESLHGDIWPVIERADQPGRSPAVLTSLITAANDVIDVHELRLASIENYLPASLLLLLFAVAGVSIGFLAWAFGAANQGGRKAIVALGLLIGAVLLLIMDVNRPQRGRIGVGVDSLERAGKAMATPPPPERPGDGALENKRTDAGMEAGQAQ